jgi:hypothetical protein
MKIDLQPSVLALATAVILFGTSVCTAAQSSHPPDETSARQTDQQNSDMVNNPNYLQGLKHGQDDHANNREGQYRPHPDNGDDRRAYEEGYDQGYQNYRSGDSNHAFRNRDVYDQNAYGYGTQSPGYQTGLREGMNDGRVDGASGAKFKYGKGYKHPDRGYVSMYGNKRDYEQRYREAYQKAYQQGYSQEVEHRK